MSPVVSPSPIPGASSGSLLVADTSATPAPGSHASLTCQLTCTGTIRWFGGQSSGWSTTRLRAGGVASATVTVEVQVATFPELSVAVNTTRVMPSG